jgi:hypothetical protein
VKKRSARPPPDAWLWCVNNPCVCLLLLHVVLVTFPPAQVFEVVWKKFNKTMFAAQGRGVPQFVVPDVLRRRQSLDPQHKVCSSAQFLLSQKRAGLGCRACDTACMATYFRGGRGKSVFIDAIRALVRVRDDHGAQESVDDPHARATPCPTTHPVTWPLAVADVCVWLHLIDGQELAAGVVETVVAFGLAMNAEINKGENSGLKLSANLTPDEFKQAEARQLIAAKEVTFSPCLVLIVCCVGRMRGTTATMERGREIETENGDSE